MRHLAEQVGHQRISGNRFHLVQVGVLQAQRADMALQRAAQRIGGHRAQVLLAGRDDVGEVAVFVLQQLQRRAGAALVAFLDDGDRAACNIACLEHGGRIHALNEGPHVIVGGVAQNLVRRAHLLHLAVLHDGDAIANAHGLVQIVRDEHDGATLDLLQAHQLGLHLGADDGVERGEGLVHQQDGGVGGQCPGQAHALLHAAREFIRVARAPAGQAYLLERLLGGCQSLLAAHAGQFQAEGGVVQHSQVRHQRKALEHHADVLAAQGAQFSVAQFVDILAVDHEGATGGLDQAVEHAHQRGFARA
ncbi:hypothetical protein D3C72_920010 [compost metagenome]